MAEEAFGSFTTALWNTQPKFLSVIKGVLHSVVRAAVGRSLQQWLANQWFNKYLCVCVCTCAVITWSVVLAAMHHFLHAVGGKPARSTPDRPLPVSALANAQH